WRALSGAATRRRLVTRPGAAAVAAGLLAVIAAGAGRLVPAPAPPAAPARTPAPAGAPNVLLLMVDTLRADHLSCYGYTGGRTPHIDTLAAEGLRFANTFSQASWTRPSVATILTGLYPASHGAVHKADILPDRIDTLAEMLARREPFFGFAHCMDPHDPYFVHPFNGEGYARVANPNPPASVAGLYRKLYDGEIAYLDEQLGVLFDDLRARGLYDRTLIVLTAD